METIKDFFLLDEPEKPEEKEKKKGGTNVTFETVTVSGPDFVIRRKTAKTGKLLVILVSQQQYYVKEENTGEIVKLTEDELSKFVKGASGEIAVSGTDGTSPFWTSAVPRDAEQRKGFLHIINDAKFCELARKNMVYTDDFSHHTYRYGNSSYVSCSPYFYKVFQILSATYEQNLLKKWFSAADSFFTMRGYHSRGYVDDEEMLQQKLYGILSQANASDDTKSETTVRTVYRLWGHEGLRLLIRNYMATPVTYIPGSIMPLFDRGKHGMRTAASLGATVFDMNRFLEYLFFGCSRQGYADNISDYIHQWTDYLDMANELGKLENKYPENLDTEHNILAYKYRQQRALAAIPQFQEAAEKARAYEWKCGGWVITAPHTAQELINEGVQMSNCIASYAKRIADGNCFVFFMRKKGQPDKPYIDIEVSLLDGCFRLAQVKRRCNRNPSTDEWDIVYKWFAQMFPNGITRVA